MDLIKGRNLGILLTTMRDVDGREHVYLQILISALNGPLELRM